MKHKNGKLHPIILPTENKSMHTIIQPSNPKQAKEIAILLQKSITELCGPDYDNNKTIVSDWLENKTEANIVKWIKNNDTYAISAFLENKIVGFGLFTINGKILLLYVLPKFKGKYIGKSLYLYIEKLLLHKGVKRVIAYSTITAKPFYLKIGFKQFKNPMRPLHK